MKPSFHARLINGPFHDPGLYVRVLREGRALLFDLGTTTNLSARDILKTSHIFVSHTHVDHFIGFDHVLRVSLKKEGPLHFYGPEGFIHCVQGKLQAYTWNLAEEYPLRITVSEVREEKIGKAEFRASTQFLREDRGTREGTATIFKNAFFSVKTAVLDHQIPCLAFSLEEDYHINIDKAKLIERNLPVGSWLRDLKMAIRAGDVHAVIDVEGRQYTVGDLRDLATISQGQKISYVVDVLGSRENREKIITLARKSDVLYMESYFLHADRDRARARYHLTAREAGRIAREAEVGRLELLHYSPRYMDDADRIRSEAQREFRG